MLGIDHSKNTTPLWWRRPHGSGRFMVGIRESGSTNNLAGLFGLASLDMPLLLHVDAVVDGVLGLMVLVAQGTLWLFATAGGIAGKMAPVAVSSGRRSGKLVLEETSVRVGATTANA